MLIAIVVGVYVTRTTREINQPTVAGPASVLVLVVVAPLLFGWIQNHRFLAESPCTGSNGEEVVPAIPNWRDDSLAFSGSGTDLCVEPDWLRTVMRCW
jgi:hypothetical protein